MEFDFLPNGRKVFWVSNEQLAIAVAHGGGHIAALRLPGLKPDINPYWQPAWPSLEPENVTNKNVVDNYGGPPEGRLLASILGHSIAAGLYGPPSQGEAAGGEVTHGKVGVQPWKWQRDSKSMLEGECVDGYAKLRFSRRIDMEGSCAKIEERIQNLGTADRPICWQQHASFGRPFIAEGFWAAANCDRGATHPDSFGDGASLVPAAETKWPFAPLRSGGQRDYRHTLEYGTKANDFTAYQLRTADPLGYFVAGNSRLGVNLFYIWPRKFFPWMGIWDEHCARTIKPWAGKTSVRAYEFGCSPFPRLPSEQLKHPAMFDLPTMILLQAGGTLWVRYILGAFRGVEEGTALGLAEDSASLLNTNPESRRLKLPRGWCSSSNRVDYP